MIEATFLTLIIVAALSADLGWFTSPSFSSHVNSTQIYTKTALSTNVWNPIEAISYNSTNGFNAQILSFTGLAFVFSGIGPVMNAMMNVPRLEIMSIATALTAMAMPIAVVALALALLGIFLPFFITMMGILTWMKAPYLWYGAG